MSDTEKGTWVRTIQEGVLTKTQKDEKEVDHPPHYGGDDNPYECIKIIEAWQLGFCDGNVIKYLSRWKTKGGLQDLRKAAWYLDRFIKQEESRSRK